MNSNTYLYEEEYEREISMKDMLAVILDKWVIVLVFLVIGALVGLGIFAIKSGQPKITMVTDQAVQEARENLNVEEIEQVDYLYAQYLSYKEYRRIMQAYMANSLFSETDTAVTSIVMYYIESDIHNVNSVFTNLALGTDDMIKIAEILGQDNQNLDDVYRRVIIEDTYSDFVNGVGLKYDISDGKDEVANKNILQVSIMADNQEQADAIAVVVDEAFQREAQDLRAMDANLVLTEIGTQYSSNVAEYLRSQQTAVINNLNDANNQINNLQINYIDKLSSDEKTYFNAMKEYDEHEITVIKKPSLKKLLVIGAAVGLIIGLLLIILWYIFSRSVKTVDDVAGRAKTDIPYVIYRKKSGFHLFGGWSRRLKGADLTDTAVVQELEASDLLIRLKQLEASSAYITSDGHTEWSREVLQSLQKDLSGQDSRLQIHVGNPLSSTEELHAFAESDAVIVAVQLKDTACGMMEKWIQLSNRYERKLAGAVVMEEC